MKPHENYHLVLTDGGAGDLICELVAVDYNIRNFPATKFHVWVPDYLLDFARHVLPKNQLIRPFSQGETSFRHDIEGNTTEWCTRHTPMRTHPVDYGFHMLSDRHVYNLNQKNYLQIRPEEISFKNPVLPYICIAATAAEPCKAFTPEDLNKIVDWICAKGFAPVFMGKEESKCGFKDFTIEAEIINIDVSSRGYNLINQTNLLQAAKVISGAAAFVGMDGGLVHLAGCTDVEIVAGYSLVDPIHVAPIRNGSQAYKFRAVEPEIFIHNRYFQTYSNFVKGDYRQFPGWQKVVKSLTAEKFIRKLEEVLLG